MPIQKRFVELKAKIPNTLIICSSMSQHPSWGKPLASHMAVMCQMHCPNKR